MGRCDIDELCRDSLPAIRTDDPVDYYVTFVARMNDTGIHEASRELKGDSSHEIALLQAYLIVRLERVANSCVWMYRRNSFHRNKLTRVTGASG